MIDAETYSTLMQMTLEFWRRVERFEYDQVMPMLTTDCRWKRMGAWTQGHDEILASLVARPKSRVVRHILSNFVMEQDGDAVVVKYLLAGIHSGGAPESEVPYSNTNLRRVGDCEDRFVKTDKGWMICELNPVAIFVGGD